MSLARRRFLQLAGAVAAGLPHAAAALDYPTRPVRIVVGFPAGSSADIHARLMGQWLSDRLGRPFVIENRPGAGSTIAVATVASASADGYTLLWATAANAIGATLYDNIDFIRDTVPVAGIIRTYYVMEVNPSVPAATIPEFIAYAKRKPGQINMASGGNGTLLHLAGEMFKTMTGVDLVHVPYRGDAPALVDLMGGQVQVMFAGLPASIGHIKTGTLRALAMTTATRWQALPDVPALAEFVPGYEASGWQGLVAPRNTPAEIIAMLNREINAAQADPAMQAQVAELGATALVGSPADFGALIAAETAKWGRVVKLSGVKPE
jgi:tripartite-type tricarboxylate transporter receptor subunit TctC